jgi:hypothetical protein
MEERNVLFLLISLKYSTLFPHFVFVAPEHLSAVSS